MSLIRDARLPTQLQLTVLLPIISTVDVQQQADSADLTGLAQQLETSTNTRLALRAAVFGHGWTPPVSAFSLPSITFLSSASLHSKVVPLLKAIESIEQTRSSIVGTPYTRHILEISTSSPVQISTAGLGEAIRQLVDFVTPAAANCGRSRGARN